MNELHLAAEARRDLLGIQSYIAEELLNPQAARSTIQRITKAIRMLREHAFIGAPLLAVLDDGLDYRFLVSGNYMVFYRVHGRDVYIDRVLYGRSDYMNILFGDLPDGEG